MKQLFTRYSVAIRGSGILAFTMLLWAFPILVIGQIWEPEGINMPGGWNSWNNPPLNNLALASSTQVTGGRVVKFSTGIQRWQTIFSVAESGGDLVGGSYAWLFTSGPSGSPWNNKWANVNVVMNTLQNYTYNNGADNQITIVNGKWYTANFEDAGYNNNRAIFMETSAQPVILSSVSLPGTVNPGQAVAVTLTLSGPPSVEEVFYLRYSTDGWNTSNSLTFSMTGISGTAQIPGQPADTTVSYYAFSSTLANVTELFDLYTIRMNNNGGANYQYTVTNPAPVITFANLQSPASGSIQPGENFMVTGHALIPGITGQPLQAPGLESWIGWNSSNTDPATWSNWVAAQYVSPSSFFDVFMGNIGAYIAAQGTWYYATRFRYNGGSYLYGGYSVTGGGFWDGSNNISGILTVLPPSVPANRILQNIAVEPEQSVCYDATQTITVAGGETFFKVLAGGSVSLVAGQKITMLPGTGIASGAYLHAWITTNGTYCGSGSGKSAEVNDAATVTVRVYPNPASDRIKIGMVSPNAAEPAKALLFTLQGQQLASTYLDAEGKGEISLTSYSAGFYLLKVIYNGEIKTIKIVKSHK